jgi:hypothetical protein
MEKIFGIVRAALASGGGFLVAIGYMDESTVQTASGGMEAIIGGIMTLATAYWSWRSKQTA